MASSAAKRYTQAVAELASEANDFDGWQRELDMLNALVSDSEIVAYLENPAVAESQKMSAVDAALTDLRPQARNLLHMLIERRRLGLLPEIVQLFGEMVMANRGVVLVDVTTADALDDAGKELVRERLKALVGKDVELRLHVDASIIGGIVARIGDQLIDGSVANQLRRLRMQLSAV